MAILKYFLITPDIRCSVVKSICLLTCLLLFCPATGILAQGDPSDKVIELKAIAGMQFDKVQLNVRPGSTVEIRFENTDEMMHNVLFVNPDTREDVVAEAESMGEEGMENDFIPQSPDVLAAIPLVKPGENASVIFQVPDEEGAYPYVCTYPAHGLVMYGVMYVTNNPEILPPVEEDPNVPEMRRKKVWMPSSFHPYPVEYPQITRLFMPDASPAAIAVGMEGKQSYCWDAGTCHLRYAWRGGYIDPSEQWNAKSDEFAEIEGEIYFKNKVGFPFRIVRSDSIPEPEFGGYQLVDGYPRFMYDIGDIKVQELVKPAKKGQGLEIEYTLDNVNQPIWYEAVEDDNIRVEASKGEWEGNILKLNPQQARELTISIIPDLNTL